MHIKLASLRSTESGPAQLKAFINAKISIPFNSSAFGEIGWKPLCTLWLVLRMPRTLPTSETEAFRCSAASTSSRYR